MKRMFLLLIAFLLLSTQAACADTPATAMETAATTVPSLTSTWPPTATPSPAPTQTPLPLPTATPATDIGVEGLTLRLEEAVFGKRYKGTFEAVGTSSSKTTLYVVFSFPGGISESSLEAVEKWDIKVKTAKGYIVSKGGDLSHMEPQPEVIWLFAVPKSSLGFTLVFPGGEIFLLDPYLGK